MVGRIEGAGGSLFWHLELCCCQMLCMNDHYVGEENKEKEAREEDGEDEDEADNYLKEKFLKEKQRQERSCF